MCLSSDDANPASAMAPAAAVNPTACKNSRRFMLVLPLLPSNFQRRYDGGRYLLTVDLTARPAKVPMSLSGPHPRQPERIVWQRRDPGNLAERVAGHRHVRGPPRGSAGIAIAIRADDDRIKYFLRCSWARRDRPVTARIRTAPSLWPEWTARRIQVTPAPEAKSGSQRLPVPTSRATCGLPGSYRRGIASLFS